MTDREDAADGCLCVVQIELHARKGQLPPYKSCEMWGLIDYDIFIPVWSKYRAAWDECGYAGEPIILSPSEMQSVAHQPGHEPEEVLVALAKYRLTGMVEPVASQ